MVLAAGTYGTQRLLHRMRDTGRLPRLSRRLGELTRTNSESLVGAPPGGATSTSRRASRSRRRSARTPDTHVEPVRYGRGSNLMGLLSVDPHRRRRAAAAAADLAARPAARTLAGSRGPLACAGGRERTVIALVMQSVDNSLVVSGRRRLGRWRLTSRHGHGAPNPTWIPAGNEAVRRLADVIDGEPGGTRPTSSARR